MFEADGVDSGQVAVQSHYSQDVRADYLAVGIERCDDGAHGATKAPGAIAHKLVNEERHAEQEEEVCDGQAEDKYVWDWWMRAELSLLHNGINKNRVSNYPKEANNSEDAGHEHIVVCVMIW